jgi:hypothetical protein
MKRSLACLMVVIIGASLLTACDDVNTVARASAPKVLTGSQLPSLVGTDPDLIVAFAHSRPGGTPTWTQVPVQVDERRVVDFGVAPGSNATPGTNGTVYGSTSLSGVTALQYADPNTFVGADPNTNFDNDDELVFMVEDAGGKPRAGEETEPGGVVAGSGVQVQLDDPLGEDDQAWVHLFVSDGSLTPSAGVDYVDYDFNLTSGNYKTTYRRADGPNPETSVVTTDAYEIRLTDRWYLTDWRISVDDASGIDILDGVKNQFALSSCARSNFTFADAEGAFVANIDGPVRAIRSYIGANSGPLTQRTHVFYKDREDSITDLRVHAIPAVMDFIDLNSAATGMTYRSSVAPAGVTINGVNDPIGTDLPDWELASGAPGSVMTVTDFDTSIVVPGGFETTVDWLYRDQVSPPNAPCWGDASYYGASGSWVVQTIPNTDPRTTPFQTLQSRRHTRFAGPSATAADTQEWFAQMNTPLAVTVSNYL